MAENTIWDSVIECDLADEIQFLASRSSSIGNHQANRALSGLDLTVRSYSILALASSGLNPSQRELADFLSLNPSQIVALVDHLAERGLVTRQQDSRDRRANGIASSDEGRRVYAEARTILRDAEDRTLSALTADERATLRELLRRVAFTDAH